jgi:mono/diheme cytochrome c family protein
MPPSVPNPPGPRPALRRGLAAALAAGILALGSGAATAQDASRGQRLFDNGCNACHGRSVFGRADRIAHNPVQLREQVVRWQKVTGLPWTPEEVDDVVAYLDRTAYRFRYPPG